MRAQRQLRPASAAQRFFFHQQVAGWSNDNVTARWRVRGKIERPALVEAIDELFRRHEALRTTLTTQDGVLRQSIGPFRRQSIAEVRIRSARTLDDAEAEEAIAGEMAAPFELEGDTPCRASLFSADGADDDLVIALVMQHAIADAESAALLYGELEALLSARAAGVKHPLQPPAAQFQDYTAWEQSVDPERHADFWRPRLAPTGSTLPLAQDIDDASPAALIGERVPVVEPIPTLRQLTRIAQEQRTTLATVVLAAVAVAFSPWTDGEALRVGVISANRFDARFRAVAGPLATVVPVRVALKPSSTFSDVLTQTRSEWIAVLAHHVPLQVMFALGGTESATSHMIQDVSVNFFGAAAPPAVMTGSVTIAPHPIARPTSIRSPGQAIEGFPCLVVGGAEPTEGLSLSLIDTDPRVVDQPTLRALAQHIACVLASLARAPGRPIRDAIGTSGHIPRLGGPGAGPRPPR